MVGARFSDIMSVRRPKLSMKSMRLWIRRNSVAIISVAVVVAGVVTTLLWLWPQLSILPAIAFDEQTPYLLSSISQSLAAILALIFTISLIVVQLSSRYSYRLLAGFFDWITITYVIAFIIAVLLPLWLLANLSLTGLKISIILAAVCLVLLIPYFLRFRGKLNPEHMLLMMKKRANAHIKGIMHDEPRDVVTIDNTVMSAYVLKDYNTFGLGVGILADLANELYTKWSSDVGRSRLFGRKLLKRIEEIGLVTIDDPRSPIQVLDALGKFSRAALDNNWDDAAEQTAIVVGNIGKKAIEIKSENIAMEAIDVLGDISQRSIKREKPPNVAYTVADVCSETIIPSSVDNSLFGSAHRTAEILSLGCNQGIDEGKYRVAGRYEYGLRTALYQVGREAAARGVQESAWSGVSKGQSDIVIESDLMRPKGLEKVASSIVFALSFISHNAIGKYKDHDATLEGIIHSAVSSIGAVGVEAARIKAKEALNITASSLIDTGLAASEKSITGATWSVVNCLYEILEEATSQAVHDMTPKICTSLIEMGARADLHGDLELREHIIDLIKNLTKQIPTDSLQTAILQAKEKTAASDNPQLVEAFERFIASLEQSLDNQMG